MKKLIYLTLVLCLIVGPITSHAWFMMLGGGGVTSGDCPNYSTYLAAYDMDHPSGYYYACFNNGAYSADADYKVLVPTLGAGEVGYGININATQYNSMGHDQPGVVDQTTPFTLWARIKKPTDTSEMVGSIRIGDGVDVVSLRIDGDEGVVARSYLSDYTDTVTGDNALSINTWTNVAVSFNFDSGDPDYGKLAVFDGTAWKEVTGVDVGFADAIDYPVWIQDSYGNDTDLYVDRIAVVEGWRVSVPW